MCPNKRTYIICIEVLVTIDTVFVVDAFKHILNHLQISHRCANEYRLEEKIYAG